MFLAADLKPFLNKLLTIESVSVIGKQKIPKKLLRPGKTDYEWNERH